MEEVLQGHHSMLRAIYKKVEDNSHLMSIYEIHLLMPDITIDIYMAYLFRVFFDFRESSKNRIKIICDIA